MIKVTNIAKNKLINLIKKEGKSIFLYIKGTGCNGFSYKFKILKENKKPNKNDEIIKLDNYNMYLCNKSLIYLIAKFIYQVFSC